MFSLYTFYQLSQPFKNLTKLNKVGSDLAVSVILEWINQILICAIQLLYYSLSDHHLNLFKCHISKSIKYEIRSRLGLSYLREHKFKYSFQDSLNSFCDYGCEIETTAYFPLNCPQLSTERNTLSTKSKALILLY